MKVKVIRGLRDSQAFFTPVPLWSGVFIIQAARQSDIPTIDLGATLSDALSDPAGVPKICRMLSDQYLFFAQGDDRMWVGGNFRPLAWTARNLVEWERSNRKRLAKPAKNALKDSRRALRRLLGHAAIS